jgi:hypothetical protein
MAGRCGPPKTVSVRDYDRRAPKRRRPSRAKPRTGGYWTCVNERGGTCGTRHGSLTAAVAHRKKLDRAARNARARTGGQRNEWRVEKRES